MFCLNFRYSKQENITIDSPEMLQFTHLLMEAKSKYSPNIKPYMKTHDILDSVDGFSHIMLNYNGIPPIKIKTKPTIFIMKRKPNVRYDPIKARKRRELNVEFQDNNEADNLQLPPDLPEPDIEQIGIIFEDIEASLEAFGKPLEQTLENFLAQGHANEAGINVAEDLIPSAETGEGIDMQEIEENESLSKSTERVFSEENREPSQTAAPEVVETLLKNEPNIDVKIEDQKTSGNVKKSVKKMIQKKMGEVKSKKESLSSIEPEVGKVEYEKQDVKPPRHSVMEKAKPVKQESKEKEEKVKPINKRNVVHVKESIRNIINQFKEFEKDLASEDPVSLKKWADDDYNDLHSEEIGAVSLEENIEEMDKYIVETQDMKAIKDVRENLKEIIDQFKELKNELSSDEDDRFDQISENYINRPISDTLMLFSEALKDLVARRKERAAKLTSGIEKNRNDFSNDEREFDLKYESPKKSKAGLQMKGDNFESNLEDEELFRFRESKEKVEDDDLLNQIDETKLKDGTTIAKERRVGEGEIKKTEQDKSDVLNA